MKFFTAVTAALAFSSAHGAVVKRVSVNLGTVTAPSVTLDPNELGLQTFLFLFLDRVQNDLATTTIAVNQLTDNAQKTFAEKYKLALATAALVKADADQIVKNVNDILAKLKPATPTQPAATPTANSGPSPTQTVSATIADIAAKAEAVLAQARVLAAAVNSQVAALATQLKATADQTTDQVKQSVDEVLSTLRAALKTISDTAETALGTVVATLVTAQGTVVTVQATATGLIIRITNAKVNLNPVLVAGVKPEVVF